MDGSCNNKHPVLAVVGPTASGKTALGVALAEQFGGEIISADSMQIYKGLDVGTAKVTPEETRGIPHHGVDILQPDEPFSVADFTALAGALEHEISGREHLPILVGGTGLYVQSFLYGVRFAAEKTPYRSLILGLDFPERAQLYRRIDLRVDQMMEQDLLNEAKRVWEHRDTYKTAAQAIGYKEFFPYFAGESALAPCVEKLKQASRNYAKRQLTWFRHMEGICWLDASAPDVREQAARLTNEFLAKG